MELKGRTALVTGGAVRIGRAICEALAAEGCRVVIHYRNSASAARELVAKLGATGSAFKAGGDISTEHGCSALMATAARIAGRIDILVNNAAGFHRAEFASLTEKGILAELRTNLLAPLFLTREFAVRFKTGRVVNMVDRRIAAGERGCLPYILSKKALAELTRDVALELAPDITVNAVAPGAVLPPVAGADGAGTDRAGEIPLKRRPTPGDVASAVLFLLKSDSITGQVIFVDGGRHLLGSASG